MSNIVIERLVTDRSESDVTRIKWLISKGIDGMTIEELTYFLRGSAVPAYAKDGVLQNSNGTIHCMDGVVKGAYNATDLNRVGEAVKYLAALLSTYGYSVSVSPKTDWTDNGYLQRSDAETYLSNISALRNALVMADETPPTPADMEKFTYKKANDIEQILKSVEDSIIRMEHSNIYCGEYYGGEL